MKKDFIEIVEEFSKIVDECSYGNIEDGILVDYETTYSYSKDFSRWFSKLQQELSYIIDITGSIFAMGVLSKCETLETKYDERAALMSIKTDLDSMLTQIDIYYPQEKCE